MERQKNCRFYALSEDESGKCLVVLLGANGSVYRHWKEGRDEREMLTRLNARNQLIHRTRGIIKKFFGTWKCSHGPRRMRRQVSPKPLRKSITPSSPTLPLRPRCPSLAKMQEHQFCRPPRRGRPELGLPSI